MSKKDAAIYREAAEMLFLGEVHYCCIALETVGGNVSAFTSAFAPMENEADPDPDMEYCGFGKGAWGKHWGTSNVVHSGDGCRVLALCFAAAMAEAGDL